MKTLIVEDDLTSRILMQEILKKYGSTHVAVHGKEAVQAVGLALAGNEPYQLICLDIMMPEMDGQTALKEIRDLEESYGILSSVGAKVIMTTALHDLRNVSNAYRNLCDGYLVKPIDRSQLIELLRKLGLLE
jgi:two-component system chemotaxis response regulator CheY